MVVVVCVNVGSSDRSPVVEANGAIGETACALIRVRACVGSIESRDLAVGPAHKTVVDAVRITIDSRDCAELIEAQETAGATCALIAAGTCTGNVKLLQFAVRSADEVVMNKVPAVILIILPQLVRMH